MCVCVLRDVSRSEVRPDFTPSRRASMHVRRVVQKKNPIFATNGRHTCRTIPCVCDARHQRLLDRTWRAAQSHRNRVSRVLSEVWCPHRPIPFRQGRVRAAHGLRRCAGGAHRSCCEQDWLGAHNPSAPVALWSRREISVTET